MENNRIELSGILMKNFEYSHDCLGEKFYSTKISSRRESGNFDTVNIIISERNININKFKCGDRIILEGTVRTRNNEVDGKKHLQLFVFVNFIDMYDSKNVEDINFVKLYGYICKKSLIRKTPLGRTIVDIIFAVNRCYNKSDYIPCIIWGRNAYILENINKEDIYITKICITGRLQSRIYNKNGEDRTAYELSVQNIDINENSSREEEFKHITYLYIEFLFYQYYQQNLIYLFH